VLIHSRAVLSRRQAWPSRFSLAPSPTTRNAWRASHREAKILAALSDPKIAVIYGLVESDGQRALDF